MFSFLGRWFGKLSISSIIENLDFDFKTQFKDGRFLAVVQLLIFGRRVYSDTFVLLDLTKSLNSLLDVDLVQKADGEYLKVQFEIGGRILFKEVIKLSSVRAGSGVKRPKTLTLDEPVDVVRENQLSHKELERLISDVALNN